MLADHVGYLFFPQEILWRLIGRISFPIFAYCIVLGYLHTKNLKKYFIRLLGFSLVSQLPYTICFFPESIGLSPSGMVLESAFSLSDFKLNVGFTMMLGLLGIYGIDRKKYLHTAIAVLLSLIPNFEYGFYGVIFMLVCYIFIFAEKSVFLSFAAISLAAPLFKTLLFGTVDFQFFAVFAVLPIALETETKIKVPRWINYGFYPLHLCILAIINFIIK